MPNTFDRSVSASAGILSAAAAATPSSIRTMPSTMEYSLCRRRCTNRTLQTEPGAPGAPPPAAPAPPPKPQTPPTTHPNPSSNVNLQGFPLAYRQGYTDGCASVGSTEQKDAARFKSDGQYRTGWQDGVFLCKKK